MIDDGAPRCAAPARRALLRRIADVLESTGSTVRLVAIDGVDGSGKTRFAEELANAITRRPVIVVHLDDFLHPRELRHRRGRSSPEGFWLDTYDYAAFRRCVVGPLAAGGSGMYCPTPRSRPESPGRGGEPERAPENAVVLVEGMFLHRDGMQDWDYSVFLAVPFEETARRMAARDGTHPDPEHPSMRRYVGGQQLYFAAARPWYRADLVIDNTDPDAPCVIPAARADFRARR